MEEPPPPRLPIVVGVTGHRDLVLSPTTAGLAPPAAAVEAELRGLLAAFPNTPILVLSGLAEGADTLVAEVALALARDPALRAPDGRPRLALVAALPMPLDACAADFRDPGHRAVVERLCAEALRTVELWRPDEVRLEGLDAAGRRALLDRGYARLAAYVSRNCHLLLALWNGRPKRAGTHGGTADTVACFERGAPRDGADPAAPSNPLRVPDGLGVRLIPCERASEPGFVADPRPADERLARRLETDAVLGQLDEFNEDVVRYGGAGPVQAPLLRAFDADAPDASGGPGPGRACAAPYLDAWGAADLLAHRYQRLRRRTILALFGLAALALLCFEFYAHGPAPLRDAAWLLAGYVVALVGSVLAVVVARRGRVEAKYLVYRSFAEALRVQATWRGLRVADRADDHYRPLHEDAIAWVRHGLKSLHVLAEGAAPPTLDPKASLAWAERTWIAAQLAFFGARVHGSERRLRALLRWSWWLFVVGLLLAPVAAWAAPSHGAAHGAPPAAHAGEGAEARGAEGDEATRHGLLLIALVVAVAASGFCRAWIGQMAYEATVDRYASALEVFRRAQRAVRSAIAAGEVAAGVEVVRALGSEALSENVGWVLLHRDHPLEIRAGG